MLRLELADNRWLAFVEHSPHALAFQHPAWCRLIRDCYGYPGFAFALADEAGDLEALVPIVDVSTRFTSRRWISLPFTDYCPPLAADAELRERVVHELDAERRAAGVVRVELRGELRGPDVTRSAEAVRHRLEL